MKLKLKDDTLFKLAGLAVLAERLASNGRDCLDCVAAVEMSHDPDVQTIVRKLQRAGLVIR